MNDLICDNCEAKSINEWPHKKGWNHFDYKPLVDFSSQSNPHKWVMILLLCPHCSEELINKYNKVVVNAK